MLSRRGAGASDVSLGGAGAGVVVNVSTEGEVCTGAAGSSDAGVVVDVSTEGEVCTEAAGSSDGFSGAATHCLQR